MKKLLLLITLLSVLFSFSQVPQVEKDALIALYNATNGSNWTNNTNWNTTQPVANWYGITVTNIGGQDYVTAIVLNYNNLQGTIPPEIGYFSHLSTLFLYDNSGIHGTIPTEIGNLTNLSALAFAWNYNMTGTIPSSITNLTNLQYLYLSYNNFSGTIPDLTTLPLSTLWLNHNNFEFGDFENEFSAYQNISDFTYTPQNSFYENYTIGYTIGDNTTLTSTVSGNNNLYQWYKVNSTTYFSSDINDATLLTGETSASLTLTNMQNTDEGFYYCIVTNTVVTSLEVKKEYFNVRQTVPQTEKDALIALYNATDGPNWFTNTNWNTSEPVASWSNVTVDNGHVITLGLAAENLTGTLPNDILNLTFLERLYVSYNNLAGTIPDLTNLSNLQTLTIGENHFQFGDFENEFSTYIGYNNSGWFSYSPMKKVATEDVYDMVHGTNYTFTMPNVSGTGVTYQWYKNDNPIPGATSLTYTITNAQASDAANYTCKASSPIVTDLTIDRNTIHLYDTVLPADKTALIALYYATDGANWTNNTNWNTSTPVHDWYGVTVVGNRVVEINLNHNNLVGTLPTQIGDLTSLTTLYLTSNQITGNIPVEIGNLSSLTSLSLNYNQLTGNIPVEIGNLSLLQIINLSGNQLSGTIPSELGNLTNLTYFDMEENQLSGEVPSSILNLSYLRSLFLWNNQLTGDLDVSNLNNLTRFTSGDNLFSSIDLRTGNNSNMYFAYFGNDLPNLTCVFVDDAAYSTANWWLEPYANFVETEAECDALFTYVPDDNFEQALIDLGYDDVLDDKVRTYNISIYIPTLDISNKNISDLTGIEDFDGVSFLYCNDNPLGTLDISGMDNIYTLRAYNCQLSNFTNTTSNTFGQLSINNNSLTNIDVSNNSALTYFNVSNNNLTDINLVNNSNLNIVYVNNNNLSNLDLRNGNNTNISNTSMFNASNNPNLTCIFVDDANYSSQNWTSIDASSTFVETEAECTALSTDNIELRENLTVFPNPTNDVLNIELNNNISIHKIDIFDINGKKINSYTNSQNISLKNYANGIYVVKINTDKGIVIKKIMKK